LLYDPPISQGVYPKELRSAYNKDACIPMFTEALFTTANICNQAKYPTTDEWIKKIVKCKGTINRHFRNQRCVAVTQW
jgi:hypothetical protein